MQKTSNESSNHNNQPSTNPSLSSQKENGHTKSSELIEKNSIHRPQVDTQLPIQLDHFKLSPKGLHSELTDIAACANDTDAKFPILCQDKVTKIKSKIRSMEDQEVEELIEEPVKEEREELEKEHHFFKKLPVVEDAEEFNIKKTHLRSHIRGRDLLLNKSMNRCKSVDTLHLPLDSVKEAKNEEEGNNAFKERKKIEDLNMQDLNEFNKADKSNSERKNPRRYSLPYASLQDSIQEEKENNFVPQRLSIFARKESHSSHHSSPCNKLKVDEIDFMEKKTLKDIEENDLEEVIPIQEVAEERNVEFVEDNKEYQAAKQKMNEEREFTKKVLKGEMINENEAVLSKMGPEEKEYAFIGGGSGAIEEVIEEDKNEY